jgi:hypothetical protein
MVVEGEAALQV